MTSLYRALLLTFFSRNILSILLLLALWVLQVSGKALCVLSSASVVRVQW